MYLGKSKYQSRLKFQHFDTNVILSNLLDNALNALSDIPNPTLEIFYEI